MDQCQRRLSQHFLLRTLQRDRDEESPFVCNFTPMEREDYRVGVPGKKQYKLILNSDAAEFGGKGTEKPLIYKAEKSECDGQPYSIAYPLPAYGVAVFEF